MIKAVKQLRRKAISARINPRCGTYATQAPIYRERERADPQSLISPRALGANDHTSAPRIEYARLEI